MINKIGQRLMDLRRGHDMIIVKDEQQPRRKPRCIIQERGENLFQDKQRKKGLIGREKLERIMAWLALKELAGGQHIVPEADRIIVLWIKGKPRHLRVLALRINPLADQGGFAGARRG